MIPDFSGTFIGNNTAVIDIFARILGQYRKMYKKRAFTHWYHGEGMDDMEFSEVRKEKQPGVRFS